MGPTLRSRHFIFLLSIAFLLLDNVRQQVDAAEMAAEEEELCYGRSCYPATGNLLIGRKKKLSATSTCGLHVPEKYCIVSHLEDQTKCFYCDSRQPWQDQSDASRKSHLIENVVTENYEDRTKNWWQSENGEQNVSIRFDLDAEFHFTHLIMTFRSFRPAAMFIERSSDYGKTWTIYRYFAYDCAATFPDIPEGPPKNHTDVICTRKYSDVAPSTGGELVYKVISPHIPTENPYADEIARLLRITNLRINFTKLHTLGDDLLDYRPEIDEKYYYALYETVVRGSCWCYGHAQSCVPTSNDGVANPPDMVYGQCKCTHNTKGANCQKCEDFYNDVPWKPAISVSSNECKRCNCNGHAATCHFDEDTYIASGNVSGGVCDDCMHNTQGKNCEQCKPYFFRDPLRPIHDPYVCRPCQCDKRGSLHEGICEGEENPERSLVAGKCYCKPNVDGTNCDRCKNGYWDLQENDSQGCKQCTCNLLGTYNNEGCNKLDGSCTCKRLVTGDNCDRCLPNHYGMSTDPDGCKACNCDIGGAFDNECDIVTGQCKCRDKFTGRRCNTTESSYYCAALDHHTYDAESSQNTVSAGNAITREATHGRPLTWTGEGFVEAHENTNISFVVDDLIGSGPYNIVIRYEMEDDTVGWEELQLTVVRPDDPSQDGPCANSIPSDDFLITRLYPRYRYIEVQPAVCLEAGIKYEIRLYVGRKRVNYPDERARVLIDSIVLAPPTENLDLFHGDEAAAYRKMVYDRFQCRQMTLSMTPNQYLPPSCNQTICAVAGAIFGKGLECECDPTGSISGICTPEAGQCQCKPNVVGRKCDRCAVGTYGFGPSGCEPCSCDSVGALSNACDKQSGQCECRDRSITGLRCDQCHPGFWSFPDCRTCQCNGHASICDQKTGACIECRNLTTGPSCDRCEAGYYGDPRLGINLPCKPCPCPGGPGSGFQHADTCYLAPSQDYSTQDVVCNCRTGYQGERCDVCSVNYWGNPREIGGSCEKCDCNDNIDRGVEGSCDSKTGHCVKCLYNTDGVQCEHCKDQFYGDAKLRNCRQCVCNHLGTNVSAGACNRVTGQCPCFPNVIGDQCDECAPHHYNIASGKGCLDCACDSNGVVPNADGEPDLECNRLDGQCHCKGGRGGRNCGECQDLHWGDPVHGDCVPCECNRHGSLSLQCHRNNGSCICRPDSGGRSCDQCSRGYTGVWPQCQPCGECFNNWDRILGELRLELESLIAKANNIEDTGISSEYDDTFLAMEKQIGEVRSKLETINITKEDVEDLRKQIDLLQEDIDASRKLLASKNEQVTQLGATVGVSEARLHNLESKVDKYTKDAQDLRDKTNDIRRSDTKGAYDLVKESAEKSQTYQQKFSHAVDKINTAETERNKAEQLLKGHEKDFDAHYKENQDALQNIERGIVKLEESIPGLNAQVCGGEAAQCDSMCGGPSAECGHCGGESCGGSVSKAAQALAFAEESLEKVRAKQTEAEELLRKMREISPDSRAAQQSTRHAFESVESAAKLANETKNALENQITEIKEFLENERANPETIQSVVDEVLGISIPFTEEKIRELSEEIRKKVLEAKNTDQILHETRGNKTVAERLQQSAEVASERAAKIHQTIVGIRDSLTEAEKAQSDAQSILDSATDSTEDINRSLGETETEVADLEQRGAEATSRIAELQNKTDKLKAEYVKITSSSKSANINAQSASDIAKDVEKKHGELSTKYTEVENLLDERVNGNEERKTRAESLHRRTTDLLTKIKSHNDDAGSLKRSTDSLDVELDSFRKQVDILSSQIDQIATQIEQRVEYHATCDA